MNNDLTEYAGVKVKVCDPPSDEEIMQSYCPDMWIDEEKRKLNENTFAKAFRDINHLQYNNGLFYTRHGKMTEEMIGHDIWESLSDIGIDTDVERLVKKLIGTTRYASTIKAFTVNENCIPFANGDFYTDTWEFHLNEYCASPYRLSAPLLLELKDTPNFDKWKKDLFYPEDMVTLREYLGYCMVFSTKAQKALFLLGEGGAGKSGIGVILQAILGDAELNIANTQEFLQDKFKLPELEHKLVLYDDDLDSSALTETGLYKKLITNTIAVTADRKFGQPFKFTPKIKLVACCNKMLSSVYDNTSGFYRRLLPIVVKPIAKSFRPDPLFYDKLKAERDGIVQWALLGLRDLIRNNWVLTESPRTKNYMEQKQSIDNPLPNFMESVFEYDPSFPGVTTTDIMRVYEVWCRKNNCAAQKPRSVQLWLADNAEKYEITPSQHIACGDKQVRGYKGIKIRSEWMPSGTTIKL